MGLTGGCPYPRPRRVVAAAAAVCGRRPVPRGPPRPPRRVRPPSPRCGRSWSSPGSPRCGSLAHSPPPPRPVRGLACAGLEQTPPRPSVGALACVPRLRGCGLRRKRRLFLWAACAAVLSLKQNTRFVEKTMFLQQNTGIFCLLLRR